jgi:hypothetical protein
MIADPEKTGEIGSLGALPVKQMPCKVRKKSHQKKYPEIEGKRVEQTNQGGGFVLFKLPIQVSHNFCHQIIGGHHEKSANNQADGDKKNQPGYDTGH